mmetsp:Transcript_11196/g.36990  ORF Transcript_11196/g.36990 Transcript_11196/m.36990 type:complete len:121 (+) Transcript_11196:49-411(+)
MTMVSSAWEQALRVKAQSAKVLSYTWRKGGRVAWVVLATSIVMLLPLLMEIEREGSVIELEKLQIKDLKAQGFSVGSNEWPPLTSPRRTSRYSRWASRPPSSPASASTHRRRPCPSQSSL